MIKRDWTIFSNSENCFTFNSDHNWEDLRTYSLKKSHKHALLVTTTKLGEV